jgi:hypothetical protein
MRLRAIPRIHELSHDWNPVADPELRTKTEGLPLMSPRRVQAAPETVQRKSREPFEAASCVDPRPFVRSVPVAKCHRFQATAHGGSVRRARLATRVRRTPRRVADSSKSRASAGAEGPARFGAAISRRRSGRRGRLQASFERQASSASNNLSKCSGRRAAVGQT